MKKLASYWTVEPVTMMRKAIAIALLTAFFTVAAGQAPQELPDIGSPASAVLSADEEYRIGAMIVRSLRDQNKIIEDPEINEYIQSLGSRLAVHAQDGQHFRFFVVRDPAINAFALPGGFIGVHHGLVLSTRNEAELASVLAHEIAHVTQRHIARTVHAQSRQGLASAAAILAAVLIGAAAGSGDAMQGAIAIAQGAAMQQQINFTRANEYEADRVGIGFLAAAGFDPLAMPSFFETMGRRSGVAATQIPELLQTHPVTTNRISESRNRAAQLDVKVQPESASYGLTRERLRVLTTPQSADLLDYYAKRRELSLGERYGKALALLNAGEAMEAAKLLDALATEHENITIFDAALGQAQAAAGLSNDALGTFERALAVSPRNVPLTVRYAEALMQTDRSKAAHAVLLDLFNNVAPTPEQIRLTALAASRAGDTGDAHYYMGEYHIASGELPHAVQQLELALAVPNLTNVQQQRYQARLDEVREYLSRNPPRRRDDREETNR